VTENRVKVSDYGPMSRSDRRLIPIPSVTWKRCKMHVLAAAAFVIMTAACYAETGIKLKAVSGWRPHRWQSWQHYVDYCIKKYGSVIHGRKWIAYDSPHETGLAVDFFCGGLRPKSATATKQKRTRLYAWLKANAHKYGFTPYLPEPWHWEYNISKQDWSKGA